MLLLVNLWNFTVKAEHQRQETLAKKVLAVVLETREKEQNQAKRLLQEKEHELSRLRIQVSRHEREAEKIDRILRGTAVSGYGWVFLRYGRQDAVLRAAIARWELGLGATARNATARRNRNPAGLMSRGKLRTFQSWEAGIEAQAELIHRLWPGAMWPEELRGYAEDRQNWINGVRQGMELGR